VLQRAAGRGDIEFGTVMDIMFGHCWYQLLTGQIDDDVKIITAMAREIFQGITRKD
jgi:hypothetical protein